MQVWTAITAEGEDHLRPPTPDVLDSDTDQFLKALLRQRAIGKMEHLELRNAEDRAGRGQLRAPHGT